MSNPQKTNASTKPKKILVVEDDAVTIEAMRRFLVENGYEVVCTQDSAMAVSLAIRERPDLMTLDLGFENSNPFAGPNFDGFGVIDFLHHMMKEANVPIIVITGRDEPDLKQRALDAGAVAFFHKSADRKTILTAIRIALNEI
jgi:DNA-binding response OmpR family regulator